MMDYLDYIKQHKVAVIVSSYFVIYAIIVGFIGPWGWFGGSGNFMSDVGIFGYIILLLLPLIILLILYLIYYRKIKILEDYLGLESISTGTGRDNAFQAIRQRAKHRIVIVGIGMTNLSRYARRTLEEQAKRVPIDLLMMDPKFLEENKIFASKLEEFLDIPDFTSSVRTSFETLKKLCEDWNENPGNINRISLKVYDTIPTMSMVMIDPEDENGEIMLEFFLYQSGEYRPRFHMKKINRSNSMFNRIRNEYLHFWTKARRIV